MNLINSDFGILIYLIGIICIFLISWYFNERGILSPTTLTMQLFTFANGKRA